MLKNVDASHVHTINSIAQIQPVPSQVQAIVLILFFSFFRSTTSTKRTFKFNDT